jgi:hypothetical protein
MGGKSSTMDSILAQPSTMNVEEHYKRIIKEETQQKYEAWKKVSELQKQNDQLKLELISALDRIAALEK